MTFLEQTFLVCEDAFHFDKEEFFLLDFLGGAVEEGQCCAFPGGFLLLVKVEELEVLGLFGGEVGAWRAEDEEGPGEGVVSVFDILH